MGRRLRVQAAVVATVLTGLITGMGCGDKKSGGAGAGPGTGSGSAVPAGAVVRVFVDDQAVAQIAQADLAAFPRLDSLLPEDARRLGTWAELTTVGASGANAVKAPSQAYPDLIPAVFVQDGAPAFGMFDPVELAKKGTARVAHTQIREIRITRLADGLRGQNDHQGGEVVDPSQLKIAITAPTGPHELTGPALLALPRVAQPDGGDHQGWDLIAVLDSLGLKDWKRLSLADAAGVSATLTRADLTPGKATAFLKLNRSGAIRFRVYSKTGTGWTTSADLRGLAAIKILE